MTGRDPLTPSANPDSDSSLGATQGGDQTLADGEPRPDDQGGLSSDQGSQSAWNRTQDLSIADEERRSVQPNGGQPVSDDYGQPEPTPEPGEDGTQDHL